MQGRDLSDCLIQVGLLTKYHTGLMFWQQSSQHLNELFAMQSCPAIMLPLQFMVI